MTDRDDFLRWVKTALYEAELALHNGDAGPRRPQTNGKAERFNKTLLDEWAYDQPYPSNQARLESLTGWLHDYNWHRLHTEVGATPASRLPVNNVCVKDT